MLSSKVNTVLLNFLRGFSPAVFNFIIALIGFSYCGEDEWGELAGIIIVLFFFNFIANWGNKEFLIRAYSEKPQNISSLFFESAISRTPFLLLAFSLYLFYSVEIASLGILIIILRYAHLSFESLVIYHQKFKTHFLAELLGFLTLIGAILLNQEFSITFFLFAYTIAALLKTLVLVFVFKPHPQKATFRFNTALIITSIPFFLISLSGWMHSKIDLYIVDFHLTPAHLSRYQILVGAFIMLDTVSAFIVQPFSKHIYRLNKSSLDKMRRILRWLVLPVGLLGSLCIYLFLSYFTSVIFSIEIYLIMALGSIPPFFYMIDIFVLFRRKQEKLIMKIGFVGAAINIIIGLIFIPTIGILGAVIAVCASKWIMMIVPYYVKKPTNLELN